MKDVIKNLASLLKVKTLVTLAVIAVFVVLALNGSISPDNVMIVISMVVSFYFGTQHEKSSTTQTAGKPAPSNESVPAPITQQTAAPATVDAAAYSKTHPDSTVA